MTATATNTVNVLFVCLGNICRSPTARGVFEHLVAEADLATAIQVDACGTAAFNVGKPPDTRAIAAASRRGLDISHYVARQIHDDDYRWGHYILGMDRSNLSSLQAWAPTDYGGEIGLLMPYAGRAGSTLIADPYYEPAVQFDAVYDTIEAAARGLLAHIRQRHSL